MAHTLHPLLSASLGFTSATGASTLPSLADWPELIEQAEQHRLIPQLHRYLIQTGWFLSLSNSAQHDLRRRMAHIAACHLSLSHALTSILKGCATAAIPCAPLRGSALATMFAPGLSVRTMDDIDLLIPKPWLGNLSSLLANLGYRQIEQRPGFAQRFSYATSFVAAQPVPLCIDVHWTLAYPPNHDGIDMEGVWKRATQREFDGAPGWTISTPDLLIHLCAHWRHKGAHGPLLWLYELDHVIQQTPDLDWSLIRDLARASEQWQTLRETLAELQNLFATSMPEWLLDPASQSAPSVASHAEAGPREEWGQLVSLPDLSTKLGYVASLLWPSPDYMRWRYGASNPTALIWTYLRRSVEVTWSVASWRLARFVSCVSRLSPRFTLFK